MYHFSRSIYRELAPDIIERPEHDGTTNHERVLRSCETCVERLATDWHYFARPTKTLFNDIRIYFPMSAQLRVYKSVDRYMSFAREYFATTRSPSASSAARPPAAARRASARRYRTTATARRTSTSPRPRTCSSPPPERR